MSEERPQRAPAGRPPEEARRQRLDHPRQGRRHDLDPRGRGGQARRSRPRRPGMPARSIRSPPASCRSRWARPPRPCRSSWTGANPTCSPSPGARRPTRTTPKARSSSGRTGCRSPSEIEALLPRFTGSIAAGAAALFGHQDPGRARLRPRPRRRGGGAAGAHGRDRPARPRRITTATARSSRPIAARAPMCAPSPAISAGRSAASAISRRSGAPASGRSRKHDAVTVDDRRHRRRGPAARGNGPRARSRRSR